MAKVFTAPELSPAQVDVLELIEELRERMRDQVAAPSRWSGSLRRMTLARAVQGSNTIEGYNASLDDVAAAVDDEPALDADGETYAAYVGYGDAMTYVLQIAADDPTVDEGLIKALHFMMLKYDLSKKPGRWRDKDIHVHREEDNTTVYTGPDGDLVPELIAAMLEELARPDVPVLVRAAIVHLNLVMIHPFRDGNGRMARCLQTLVLAREHIVAPVFSSIEEYLGRNTNAYYDILAQVGMGSWHPQNDPGPWVDFCLTAHYHQASTHLRRIEEIGALWRACVQLANRQRLQERTVPGLVEAAYGFRLRNSSYRSVLQWSAGEQISDLTASRDLKAMVDAGFLDPVGERRGRYYVATQSLRREYERIRAARPPRSQYDPFEAVRDRRQMSLMTDEEA